MLYFFIILYFAYIVISINLSSNLDTSDIRATLIQIFIPFVILGTLVYQYEQKAAVFSSFILLFCLAIGTLNGFTYPLLRKITGKTFDDVYLTYRDVTFGIYVSIWLLCLYQILKYSIASKYIIVSLFLLISFLLCIFPILQIAFFVFYGYVISVVTVDTIINTYINEVKEYFRTLPKLLLTTVITLLIFVYWLLFYYLNCIVVENNKYPILPFFGLWCIFSFICFRPSCNNAFMKTSIGKMIYTALSYKKDIVDSFEKHFEKIRQLDAVSLWPQDFGSIILVIGESANRDHMQSYSNYPRETTPWLNKVEHDSGFFIFRNVYSSFVMTIQCLSLALTNANQYNKLKVKDAYNIVEIANKCGFSTHWYSNQGFVSSASSVISIIGSMANKHRWMMQDTSVQQFDEALLKYLKKIDTSNSLNKLIVLHLKGSHVEYSRRYPEKFAKWKIQPGDKYGDEAYDNSILYTDYILEQIYEYARENLHLRAMVYCSDHGAVVGRKRVTDFTGFTDVRVPAFVYLDKIYKDTFPKVFNVLGKNKEKYVTNDLLFDLLMGIMQVESPLINERYNIASEQYGLERKDLLTNLGRVHIEEENTLSKG